MLVSNLYYKMIQKYLIFACIFLLASTVHDVDNRQASLDNNNSEEKGMTNFCIVHICILGIFYKM